MLTKTYMCIVQVLDACRQYAELNNKWVVLPLHSTLSLAEQEKVFDYPPEGIRKVYWPKQIVINTFVIVFFYYVSM